MITMLQKELRRHPVDYLVLLGLILIFCLGILAPWASKFSHQFLSILLGFGYTTWGIWHHRRQKNLEFGIVLEYLLLGGLVSLVLFFVVSTT